MPTSIVDQHEDDTVKKRPPRPEGRPQRPMSMPVKQLVENHYLHTFQNCLQKRSENFHIIVLYLETFFILIEKCTLPIADPFD